MKCQSCHHTVTRKSKFCPNCGDRIVPRSSTKKTDRRTRRQPAYLFLLVAAGVLLGVLIVKLGEQTSEQRVVPSAGNTALSIQSQAVLDIAKEFYCFCGTCEDRLDECECEHVHGAIEVKTFIAQQLRDGHKKPHIMEMVNEKYGGLLPPPGDLNSLKDSDRP